MKRELISRKTRQEFREFFVGWTLREIADAFEAAHVDLSEEYIPSISGQRRQQVERYYGSVDWTNWNDTKKILSVFSTVLYGLEQSARRNPNESYHLETFGSLLSWLVRDGFEYRDGRLTEKVETQQLFSVHVFAGKFEAPEIQRQIARMNSALDDDPALAIGTAKELIETVCKIILTERGMTLDERWDITELTKEARKVLGLLPDDIPQESKGAATIKRLLSNLAAVSQGIAELRNLYGTGHGKHGTAKGLTRRHAKLAVGAASTLVTFLFETHEERIR